MIQGSRFASSRLPYDHVDPPLEGSIIAGAPRPPRRRSQDVCEQIGRGSARADVPANLRSMDIDIRHSHENRRAWQAGRRAIEEHLAKRGLRATVGRAPHEQYQVEYELPVPPPRVSILVPTTGNPLLLGPCLDSVLSHTTYENFEVLLLVNEIHRHDPDRAELLRASAERSRVRVLSHPDRPFNLFLGEQLGRRRSLRRGVMSPQRRHRGHHRRLARTPGRARHAPRRGGRRGDDVLPQRHHSACRRHPGLERPRGSRLSRRAARNCWILQPGLSRARSVLRDRGLSCDPPRRLPSTGRLR
jgi:hypothetical protein